MYVHVYENYSGVQKISSAQFNIKTVIVFAKLICIITVYQERNNIHNLTLNHVSTIYKISAYMDQDQNLNMCIF